jgi:beta-phosphoglucomutase-like phosphatase (HAD superfamily)/CMP-N-acetylneuraminic acid synthetase
MATAFVPLKLHSRRLPNKNFLLLNNKPLCSYIFETLLLIPDLNSVYCYTSQPQVLKLLPPAVKLLPRPTYLDNDDIKANELFDYAVRQIDDDIIVLCHATGPLISMHSIAQGLHAVENNEFTSSVAVRRLQTYCWFDDKPLNYTTANIQQTQDITPVFEETSGFYVFRKTDYLRTGSRISSHCKLVEVSFNESIDIDTPEDFAAAHCLLDYERQLLNVNHQYPYFSALIESRHISNPIKHVSFDLDGVLIDSLSVMESAWYYACSRHNLDINFDLYKQHIGKSFAIILESLSIPRGLHDSIATDYEFMAAEGIASIQPFTGSKDLILYLQSKGIKVSVVTSKARQRALATLSSVFLGVKFDSVVTPSDVGSHRGKPCPDTILLACIQTGCSPSETVYIGDMDVDRLAADNASCNFIQAGWGYDQISEHAPLWFFSFDELGSFLASSIAI